MIDISGSSAALSAPKERARAEPAAPALSAPTHRSVEAHNAERPPLRAASVVESLVSSNERYNRLELARLQSQRIEAWIVGIQADKRLKRVELARRKLQEASWHLARLAEVEALQAQSVSGSQAGSVGRRITDVQSGTDEDLVVPHTGRESGTNAAPIY